MKRWAAFLLAVSIAVVCICGCSAENEHEIDHGSENGNGSENEFSDGTILTASTISDVSAVSRPSKFGSSQADPAAGKMTIVVLPVPLMCKRTDDGAAVRRVYALLEAARASFPAASAEEELAAGWSVKIDFADGTVVTVGGDRLDYGGTQYLMPPEDASALRDALLQIYEGLDVEEENYLNLRR